MADLKICEGELIKGLKNGLAILWVFFQKESSIILLLIVENNSFFELFAPTN